MSNFDYYELRAVITPGALTLGGFFLAYPYLYAAAAGAEFGVGDLGLFLILAYSIGHLVSAVGNIIEEIWWRVQGGWPSEWIRQGKRDLLSDEQRAALPAKIHSKLGLPLKETVGTYTKSQWAAVANQIKAALHAAHREKRLESFNSNYGLFRGILAAGLIVLPFVACKYWSDAPLVVAAVGASIGLAGARFQRFGRRYSQELFTQFLQLE